MTSFETVYSVFMILIFAIIGTSLIYEKKARISPTPVLPNVRKKALGLIPEKFHRTEKYKIADLGCGWGGLLMALSRKFPESSITGYELSPWPF